jgi:hypothetical protein
MSQDELAAVNMARQTSVVELTKTQQLQWKFSEQRESQI